MNQTKEANLVCAAEGPTTLKLDNNWIMSVHNYVLMLSNITAGDFNFLFSYQCIRLTSTYRVTHKLQDNLINHSGKTQNRP